MQKKFVDINIEFYKYIIRFKDVSNHFLILFHVTHLCTLKNRFLRDSRTHKTRLIVNLIRSFRRPLVGVKIRGDKLRWRESRGVGETRATSRRSASYREPPSSLPRGWLVEPTSGAESKLIQVLAFRGGAWEICDASQTCKTKIRRRGESFIRASLESDKLHPQQSTGALKFPNAETLHDREVRRDRLSGAPATRGDRSHSRLRRGSASMGEGKGKGEKRSKFSREIFIRPSGSNRRKSLREVKNLRMT